MAKKYLIGCCSSLNPLGDKSFGGASDARFLITGLSCPVCAYYLARKIHEIPGVLSVVLEPGGTAMEMRVRDFDENTIRQGLHKINPDAKMEAWPAHPPKGHGSLLSFFSRFKSKAHKPAVSCD
jgi:copper chaperone CopZ